MAGPTSCRPIGSKVSVCDQKNVYLSSAPWGHAGKGRHQFSHEETTHPTPVSGLTAPKAPECLMGAARQVRQTCGLLPDVWRTLTKVADHHLCSALSPENCPAVYLQL